MANTDQVPAATAAAEAAARANAAAAAAAKRAQQAAEKAAMLRNSLIGGLSLEEPVKPVVAPAAKPATSGPAAYDVKSDTKGAMTTPVDFTRGPVHGPLYWDGSYDSAELRRRASIINHHFSNALGIDDYMIRTETVLAGFGFQASNTIAMCNLCRDEITRDFRRKVENVYGMPFITQGLGAVMTTGKTGFGAGLHHAPLEKQGAKERVIFFSFPHIAIDADGEVGSVHRPGRCGQSNACGALIGALKTFQGQAAKVGTVEVPEVDMNDPEFSILKNRLCVGMEREGIVAAQLQQVSLVDMTKLAERQITKDIEALIEQTVDTAHFDYAVCTGVHIHQWSLTGPRCDYVAPGSMYAVVDGKRHELDISSIPPLPPRLLRLVEDGHESIDGVNAN